MKEGCGGKKGKSCIEVRARKGAKRRYLNELDEMDFREKADPAGFESTPAKSKGSGG